MKPLTPISEFERELARTVGEASFPPATAAKRFIHSLNGYNGAKIENLSAGGRWFLAFIAHRFRRQYRLTPEQWQWVNDRLSEGRPLPKGSL